jgi:hypothetical protein
VLREPERPESKLFDRLPQFHGLDGLVRGENEYTDFHVSVPPS